MIEVSVSGMFIMGFILAALGLFLFMPLVDHYGERLMNWWWDKQDRWLDRRESKRN